MDQTVAIAEEISNEYINNDCWCLYTFLLIEMLHSKYTIIMQVLGGCRIKKVC